MSEPVAVVLDHLEALSNAESRRSVAAFAQAVPAGWTLALASREEVPLPVARMRVEGHLLEIGADDLAMSGAEASRLLAAAGVELSDARAARLAWDTEGWPAALYLAALALEAGEAAATARSRAPTGRWSTTSGPRSWTLCRRRNGGSWSVRRSWAG